MSDTKDKLYNPKVDWAIEQFCYQTDAYFSADLEENKKTLNRMKAVGLISKQEADDYLEYLREQFQNNPYKQK